MATKKKTTTKAPAAKKAVAAKKPAAAKKAVAAKKPAAPAAKKVAVAKKPVVKAARVPASDTVTLKNISVYLAETHELSKKQMNTIMDDLVETLVENLKKDKRIRMAGLGVLQVRKRAARMGRNPATGEAIKIAASKKVAFRAAKELKEAVGAGKKK